MSCNPLDPKNHSSAIVEGPAGSCKTGLIINPPALYFGAAVVGEDPLTLSFTVKNQGYKTLRIENVELTGEKFTLLGSAPALLKGDQEFTMEVEYSSDVIGTFNGMVLIYTNEREEPYVLGLSGRILGSTYMESITAGFTAMVLEETWARTSADEAEAGHRLTLQASLETADSIILARVVQEEIARVDGDEAEATARQVLTADYNETKASLETEITVRSTQYEALAESIETLEAEFFDEGEIEAIAQALVNIESTARANEDEALASRIEAIEADYTTEGQATSIASALVSDEADARADADGAAASRLDTIEADYTTASEAGGIATTIASAAVATEASARVSGDTALASRSTQLEASMSTNAGSLVQNVGFGIWPDGNQVPTYWTKWDTNPTVTRSPNGMGGYAVDVTVLASAGNFGLLQGTNALNAAGYYVAEIDAELISGSWNGAGVTVAGVVGFDMSTTPDVNKVTSSSQLGRRRWAVLFQKTADSSINWHLMWNWTGHGSLADKRLIWYKGLIRPATTPEIKANEAVTTSQLSAAIADEATLRVTADNAEATLRTAITTRLDNFNGTGQTAEARLTAEESARVSADSAEAALRAAITARLNNWNGTGITGEAAVTNASNAYVTPLASEASLRSAITARLDNWNGTGQSGEARLTAEENARASADSAEATLRAAITARLNNLDGSGSSVEARVSTLASASADHTGKLEAYWQVDAVAGGRAQLKVWADAVGGGGVDIIGDVNIDGDLMVNGSINGNDKIVPASITAYVIEREAINIIESLVTTSAGVWSITSPDLYVDIPEDDTQVILSFNTKIAYYGANAANCGFNFWVDDVNVYGTGFAHYLEMFHPRIVLELDAGNKKFNWSWSSDQSNVQLPGSENLFTVQVVRR